MIRRLVVAVAAAFVASSGAALAAPARTVTVTPDAPATWEGGPGNGSGQGVAAVRCAPLIYECEDTLVDLKGAGDLTAEITGDDTAQDLDVAIYKSDAAGTAPGPGDDSGEPIAEDISTNKDAKVTARRLQPGFYVVRVRFFFAVASFYTGKATLVAPPPPVEPPPPPAAPPATSPSQSGGEANAKQKKAKAKCRKKAKRIKNKKKRKAAMKRCKRKS